MTSPLTPLQLRERYVACANRLAEWINQQPVVKDGDGNPTVAPVYDAWAVLCALIDRHYPDPAAALAPKPEKE